MKLTYVPNRVIRLLLHALRDAEKDVRKAAVVAWSAQTGCRADHRLAPLGLGG